MSTHDMTASQVVSQLRAEVEEKTGLTMSAGIAPNRVLAKVSASLATLTLDLLGQEQAEWSVRVGV
jgi:nucleotidyltransferase/DNA polymerase involved in DNA repair